MPPAPGRNEAPQKIFAKLNAENCKVKEGKIKQNTPKMRKLSAECEIEKWKKSSAMPRKKNAQAKPLHKRLAWEKAGAKF